MRVFDKCLAFVLQYEGGVVENRRDPGGLTNKGVTQRVYNAYRKRAGAVIRSVRLISTEELQAIYRGQYWTPIRGEELPTGVNLALFDYAVNSGVTQAVKDIQRVVGVRADGVMGVITLHAIERAAGERLIAEICTRRLRFVRGLNIWRWFSKGWTARINAVKAASLEMLK